MSLVSMAVDGVKKDIKKIDRDKNGKPDVIEALDKAEAALEKVEKYASRIKKEHIQTLLQVANRAVHPAIFNDAEIVEFAEALSHIDEAAHVLKSGLEEIEKQLS